MIDDHQIHLVSSYFQFSKSTESHLESWDRILDKLHNKGTVIASDPCESSTKLDTYRRYESPARDTETFIDVTLATSKGSQRVVNWEMVEESSDDHRLILYEILLTRSII
ncbi:hypothetical protein PR048_033564 [Dryococelus australis]|uniref:Endonuclease/exonuclease/phosphatase domain-containing protein n=1 Tax=Dryococelus australis TaxID=614101 RepID=A0ABQ9G0M7_9NEOP|nr:hypothetical protein PR048_033564 [Dryococelus australis]